MFCSKCGKELPDDSIFCNVCGQQIKEVTKLESAVKEKSKREKKPINKKVVKAVIIIFISMILIAAMVWAAIFVLVPMTKYNNALDVMEEGNYVEAYKVLWDLRGCPGFDYEVYYDCFSSAICQLIEEDKIEDAFEFCDTYYNYNGIDFEKLSAESYEKYYNGIVKILNREDFLEKIKNGGCIEFICGLLKRIPITYNDVDHLRVFCDDLHTLAEDYYYNNGYKYVLENRDILKSLWRYTAIRQLATKNAKAFLIGREWKSIDGSQFLEFDLSDDGSSFYKTNLNTPSVESRYYEIENMVLYFCNAGNAKVCDVFRFEFDDTDPSILNVYCYADGKTITLFRKEVDVTISWK